MSAEIAVEVKEANVGRWKRYLAYKDSGVEWIEEVPEHWGETITSALFMDNKKKNKGTQETNLLSLSYGNIIRKDINTNDGLLPETFEAYQIVDPGYIILRLTDLQNDKKSLRVGHVNEKGIITSAYTGLRKKSDAVECSKYFYYLLYTYDLIKVFYGMGAGVRQSLNFNELRKLRLLLPLPEEQSAIATFLDHETVRIDTLIEKKERQIELLQEKRAALISHAVTKGLDPDVKIKDSRVEWLGKVPDEWGIVRVKLLEGNDTSVVQTGPFGAQLHASDYLDEGIPLILIRNVRDLKIDETDIPRISEEDAERLFMYRLNVGDIVFSRVGSIGRIALCTEREKGWLISGQMLRLRIQNPMLDSKFSLYAFSSKCLLTFVELQSVGSTRESINTDILRNMPIPVPPLPEQRAIVSFLYRETGRIDILTTKVRESISKLSEYRIALISAAVTGKIDVRQEAMT